MKKLFEKLYKKFDNWVNENFYRIQMQEIKEANKKRDEAYKLTLDYCREEAIKKCRKNGKTYHILPVDDRYISLCKDDFEYHRKRGTIKKSATMVDILKMRIESIEYKNLK